MCPKEGHMYNLLTVLYIKLFAYVILYIYCYTEALKLSNASAVLVFSYNIFTNAICFYNLFTYYRCPKEGHMYNLLTVLYINMFAYVILYIWICNQYLNKYVSEVNWKWFIDFKFTLFKHCIL